MVSVLSVLLAAISLTSTTYEQVITVGLVLVALNTIGVATSTYEALQNRVLGKLFLIGSVYAFFWLGVLDNCLRDNPFYVSSSLRIGIRRWPVDLVNTSLLYIAMFQLLLLVGYSLRPRMRMWTNWVRNRQDYRSPTTRVLPYAFGALGVFTALLAYGFDLSLSTEVMLAGRNASVRAQDIGLLHFLDFFALYGAATVFNEVMLSNQESRAPRSLRVISALIFVAPFLFGGARHIALFVILPSVVLSLIRWKTRLTPRQAIRWILLAAFAVALLQVQFAFRQTGWTTVSDQTVERLKEVDAFGQFGSLNYALFLVPSHHDYFMEFAEPYFLIHWIPRVFWPDKPVMQSWSVFNYTWVGKGVYNVTPSIIGQFHMNFGVVGVLWSGLWIGLLMVIADTLCLNLDFKTGKAMAIVMGMFYAFLISSFRFYSPIYFYYFVFGFIGMLTMTRTVRPAPTRVMGAAAGRWHRPVPTSPYLPPSSPGAVS